MEIVKPCGANFHINKSTRHCPINSSFLGSLFKFLKAQKWNFWAVLYYTMEILEGAKVRPNLDALNVIITNGNGLSNFSCT